MLAPRLSLAGHGCSQAVSNVTAGLEVDLSYREAGEQRAQQLHFSLLLDSGFVSFVDLGGSQPLG